MTLRHWILGLALTIAPSVVLAQASASPPRADAELAAAHYDTGMVAYRAGRFREAASEFRIAFELSHQPALLFNLASASYDAGDFAQAGDAYAQYLAALPDAPNRELVQARVEVIRRRLSSPPPVAPSSQAPRESPASSAPVARHDAVAPASPVPWVGVGFAALGAVALGLGAGFYVDADRQFHTCQSRGGCLPADEPRGQDIAAVGLMWGGGAAFVLGATLFLLTRRQGTPERRMATVTFDPRGLIGIQGAF